MSIFSGFQKKYLLGVLTLVLSTAIFSLDLDAADKVPILYEAKRLQTEHFEVIFSPDLEPIAREAASIAEQAHQFWRELLGFDFAEPIFIVMTDRADEASSFSVVLPQLVIYLEHPFGTTYLLEQRREFSTLEYLIYREVGNLLDSARAEGFPKELRALFGNILLPRVYSPYFYHSGLAALETMDNSFSAMILAALSESGQLPTLEQLGTNNPLLSFREALHLQVVSKELLEYIRTSSGNEAFRELYQFAAAYPLPSVAIGTIQTLTGKTLGQLLDEFNTQLTEDLVARSLDSDFNGERMVSPTGVAVSDSDWSPDGASILYVAEDGGRTPGLRLVKTDGTDERALLACQCRSARWLDGTTLVYSKAVMQDTGNFFYDLFTLDLPTMTERRLTIGERIWAVQPLPGSASEALVLRNGISGKSDLVLFNLVTRSRRIIQEFGAHTQPISLAVSQDGQSIAVALRNRGQFEIEVLNLHGAIQSHLEIENRKVFDPEFSSDGHHLFFTSDFEGRYQLYALRLRDEQVLRVKQTLSGERAPRIAPDGSSMAWLRYTSAGFSLLVGSINTSQLEPVGLPKNLNAGSPTSVELAQRPIPDEIAGAPIRQYEVDSAIIPTFWVPIAGQWHIGEFTMNREPAGKIDYQISLGSNLSPIELFYDFQYNHKTPFPWVRVRLQGTASYQLQTALLEFPISSGVAGDQKNVQIGVYRSPEETEIFSGIHLAGLTAFDLGERKSAITVRAGWSTTIAGLVRRVASDWDEQFRLPISDGAGPHQITWSLSAAWSDLSEYRLGGPDGDRPLRGFSQVRRGSQRLSLNLAYQFPIWNIRWGCCPYHPLPFFIDQLRGSLFSDLGAVGRSLEIEELRAGLGVEFQLHLILGYGLIDGWIRGGFAYGIGTGQPQIYFKLEQRF